MKRVLFAFLVALMLISSSNAVHWSASVGTNTSSWHIYRQSETMAFDVSSFINGEISPVKYHSNIINPHYSNYLEIADNDVGISERTSAYSGSIYAESSISLKSDAENDINITISKPYDIATFEHNERWPVFIVTNGRLEYIGKEINSLKSQRNSGDYVKENFRYGPELVKQWRSISLLERMNATVKATNDAIISADFMPTRYLAYEMNAHTTGLADLSYMLTGPNYDFQEKRYQVLAQGVERYFGTHNISMMIEMRSLFNKYNESETWLPCCSSSCFAGVLRETADQDKENVFN